MGLKDVFIIGNPRQTRTFGSGKFKVTYSLPFAPPTQTAPIDESNGIMLEAGELVSPEAINKTALDRQLERVEAGRGLEKVGRNKWVAGKRPVFRYVRICNRQIWVVAEKRKKADDEGNSEAEDEEGVHGFVDS